MQGHHDVHQHKNKYSHHPFVILISDGVSPGPIPYRGHHRHWRCACSFSGDPQQVWHAQLVLCAIQSVLSPCIYSFSHIVALQGSEIVHPMHL